MINKLGNFELDKIYCGDCQELMKDIPDNSIDLIVTDPPYQLSSTSRARPDQTKEGSYGKEVPFLRQQSRIKKGFMGKEWDVLPPIEVWKESLRILKPGAFAFIMTTPRQDSLCQILMDLTNAGFFMGFSSIYWTYASGFPKASNISKMVDKKPKRLLAGKMRNKLNEYRIKAGLSIKQINEYFGFATTGSGVVHHWMIHPTQPTIPTQEQYQKLKKLLKIENSSLDKLYIEAKREVTGKDKNWGKKGSTPLTGYGGI